MLMVIHPKFKVSIDQEITQDEYEKIRDILVKNFQRDHDDRTTRFYDSLKRFDVSLKAEVGVGAFTNEYLREKNKEGKGV